VSAAATRSSSWATIGPPGAATTPATRTQALGHVRQPTRGTRLAAGRPQVALHVDGLFVVRTGDAGVNGALPWALPQSPRADAAAVVQSVTGETATDTGVVTAAADDRVPDVSEPPAAPPSPLATPGCDTASPAVFDAL
jgi:dTDP-glucose pyrophosphorylase